MILLLYQHGQHAQLKLCKAYPDLILMNVCSMHKCALCTRMCQGHIMHVLIGSLIILAISTVSQEQSLSPQRVASAVRQKCVFNVTNITTAIKKMYLPF